jgi:hypothetical protein
MNMFTFTIAYIYFECGAWANAELCSVTLQISGLRNLYIRGHFHFTRIFALAATVNVPYDLLGSFQNSAFRP